MAVLLLILVLGLVGVVAVLGLGCGLSKFAIEGGYWRSVAGYFCLNCRLLLTSNDVKMYPYWVLLLHGIQPPTIHDRALTLNINESSGLCGNVVDQFSLNLSTQKLSFQLHHKPYVQINTVIKY